MTELGQLKSRSITLITGYIKGVDQKPKQVKVKQPFSRLAVIVNCYYPEFRGAGFFDHVLVLKLCSAIGKGRPTQVRGVSEKMLTLEELEAHWQSGWESDDHDDPSNNDVFDELLIFEKGEVIIHMLGHPYLEEGGPEPYNDDDTLEIFMPEAMAEEVARVVQTTAIEANAKVKLMEGVSSL